MSARQWLRLGMALGAVLVVLWIAWLAGAALAPFALGALLAYLLAPLVQCLAGLTSWRGRPEARWARPAAILVIYGIAAGALSGIGLLVAPVIARAFQDLLERREEIIAGVQEQIEGLLVWYRARVPEEVQEQIDGWVQTVVDEAGTLLGEVVQNVFGFALQSLSVLLGFLVIPIWLFLFMKDEPRFAAWFYSLFPAWLRPDVREVVRGAGKILGTYIRAQVLLAFAVGALTYAGLALLGAPFALPLAVTAFFLEFIPVIGPILAGVIALAVVLAVEPGWLLLWVLLLYVGIQQVESYVLLPRIQGGALHVHPALIILLVVLLSQIMGVIGVLIAVPAYALFRNTFAYIYRRLGEGEVHDHAVPEPRQEREAVSPEPPQRPLAQPPGQSDAAAGPPTAHRAAGREPPAV